MLHACRLALAANWCACFAASVILTASYPMVYVPVASALRKRKRSINKHSQQREGALPKNYWFVVMRALAMLVLTLAWELHYMATRPHVHWTLASATPLNTVAAFLGCILVREVVNYFVHRANHSSHLLYSLVHEAHHKIPTCHGLYDGLYAAPLDTVQAVLVVFSPLALLPSIHVLSALSYIVTIGFLGFVLNHCGREVRLDLPVWLPNWLPDWFTGGEGALVLYSNQPHDDHHVFRRGNYADMLPLLDRLFGTEITVRRRPKLPAQLAWQRASRRWQGYVAVSMSVASAVA